MKIDPSKKYTTRDGVPVTHLHRAPEDWPTAFPWRGIVGGKTARAWTEDGVIYIGEKSQDDLIEVREPKELCFSIDKNGTTYICYGNETAERWDDKFPKLAPHRIVTFREVLP